MQRTFTTRYAMATIALCGMAALTSTAANATQIPAAGAEDYVSILTGDQGQFILSRRGADDPAGDDRGGRGRGGDDGPNHAAIELLKSFDMARRGADDPAGDDRGGRGRGGDDGPNHT